MEIDWQTYIGSDQTEEEMLADCAGEAGEQFGTTDQTAIALGASLLMLGRLLGAAIRKIDDLRTEVAHLDSRCDYICGHVGIDVGV
jgi:hypothetical protein